MHSTHPNPEIFQLPNLADRNCKATNMNMLMSLQNVFMENKVMRNHNKEVEMFKNGN